MAAEITQNIDDKPKLKHLNKHIRGQLCAACESNSQAWKDLGAELIPDDDAVRAIAASNPNDLTKCCALMLDKWLEREPNASWRQLIEALNEIGLNNLAAAIKKKLESSTASLVPKATASGSSNNGSLLGQDVQPHELTKIIIPKITESRPQSDSRPSAKPAAMPRGQYSSDCPLIPPHSVSETVKPLVKIYQMNTHLASPTPSHHSPSRATPSSGPAFSSFAEGLQSGNYNINWTRCADLPSPMYGASVAGDDEIIYAAAGCAPGVNTYDYIFQYKIKSGRWSRMPGPGHSLGILLMIEGRLNVFGGHDAIDKTASNKVSTLTADQKTWIARYPNMINVRIKPGVVLYKDHIIVAGGARDKNTFNNDIEILNWQQLHLSWERVDITLPVPMWAMSMTVSGDKLLIVGYTQAKGRSASVYQISAMAILEQPFCSNEAPTETWVKLCSAPHHDATLIPYSDPPVVIGGYSHGLPTMEISFYSALESCWKTCGLLSSARISVAVANVHSDSIIVVGGNTKGDTIEAAMCSTLTMVELGQLRRLSKPATFSQV